MRKTLFAIAAGLSLIAAGAAFSQTPAQKASVDAAKTGVTVEAAGQATARQLYDRIPTGQWYKPLGGSWTKK